MIELRATLDHPRIRPDAPTEVGCQLELRPADIEPVSGAQLSTNLCLVFDCSASMAGAKAKAAIQAAQLIVNTIDARHRVSLVGFATSHWVVVDNACPAETGRDDINRQIERLRELIRGGTNLGEGIRRGIKVVQRHQADASVLVVLTDGQADSPADAVRAGVEANKAGIQVFAVGIGDDFHADDLLKVVAPSGGAVLGERDAHKLEAAFATLLQRIESFVATNARLDISIEQGVTPGAVYKTAPERMFIGDHGPGDRTIRLHVGNLERGQSYGFVVSLTPPTGGTGELAIANATLRYDVPARRLRDQRADAAITIRYDEHAEPANPEVMRAHQRAQLAALVEELAESERKRDRDRSEELLELLRMRSAEAGDARLLSALEGLTSPIPRSALNALVLAATARDVDEAPAPSKPPPPPPRRDPPPPPRTRLTPPPPSASPPPPPPAPSASASSPPLTRPEQAFALSQAPAAHEPSAVDREPPAASREPSTASREPSAASREPLPPPPPAPPAPPPPAPAPPPPPPAPPRPSNLRSVMLLDPGPSVIELIRVLRDLTGLGLAQCHELIQSVPSQLLQVSEAEARAAKKRLEALGARVDVTQPT